MTQKTSQKQTGENITAAKNTKNTKNTDSKKTSSKKTKKAKNTKNTDSKKTSSKKTKKAKATESPEATVQSKASFLDEPFVEYLVSLPDGQVVHKRFRKSRAPQGVAICRYNDSTWGVLGWSSLRARAEAYVTMAEMYHIDEASPDFKSKRYEEALFAEPELVRELEEGENVEKGKRENRQWTRKFTG